MVRIFSVAALGLLLTSLSAHVSASVSDAIISRVDANGDHTVSRSEVASALEREYGRADADQDGQLTLEELQVVVAEQYRAHAAARFAQLDRDADGRLRRAEAQGISGQRFRALDTSGDGTLSVDEFAVSPRPSLSEYIAWADADRNLSLTRAEVATRVNSLFTRLDRNQNEELSPTELAQAKRYLFRAESQRQRK